jgi:hypothetical protein
MRLQYSVSHCFCLLSDVAVAGLVFVYSFAFLDKYTVTVTVTVQQALSPCTGCRGTCGVLTAASGSLSDGSGSERVLRDGSWDQRTGLRRVLVAVAGLVFVYSFAFLNKYTVTVTVTHGPCEMYPDNANC